VGRRSDGVDLDQAGAVEWRARTAGVAAWRRGSEWSSGRKLDPELSNGGGEGAVRGSGEGAEREEEKGKEAGGLAL